MKRRIAFLLAVILLLAAILFVPGSKKVEKTVSATEYSFTDPDYAVSLTVSINGHDTRNLIGSGRFEGIFAAEGWDTAQEGWKLTAKFPIRESSGNAYALDPASQPVTANIHSLLPDRRWDSFVILLQEVSDLPGGKRIASFDPQNGHFIVNGSLPRTEAWEKARSLTEGTPLEALFAAAASQP